MARKRLLVADPYNVIAIFRKLGVSFEEIAALGFEIEGEPDCKVTGKLLEAWFEEQKLDRTPTAGILTRGKKPRA